MISARRSPRRTGTSAARSQSAGGHRRIVPAVGLQPGVSAPLVSLLRVADQTERWSPAPDDSARSWATSRPGSASSRRSTASGRRDHRERVLVRLAGARPRHGRARPAPVHHADGPRRRPLRASTSSAPTSRRCPTASPHAPVSPGREAFCGAAWHAGPDRPAAHRRLDRHARVHDRRDVQRRRPRPVHRRVDSLEQHREGVAPLLYFRRRYLRIEQGADSPVEGKPEG